MKQNSNRQHPAPCFKRWSRKSFGVFASLHRYVTIGVLSVGMSIILLASTLDECYAVDTLSRGTIYRLDSAQIVGNRISPTRSVMSQTVFYNRKSETAAPFQTIESVLRVSPSFDIRERGGKGIQTDISIRGGSFDQTMVMLNGINFTDARTGHQTHSLPIDIESIASIELIDGVTGTGAYAGAVNFKTQPLFPTYLKAEIQGGDHGYMYANLNGAYTKDKFSLYATGSYRRSDGYRHNTNFSNINAFIRGTYQSKKIGYFDIQAGYQTRDFGANGFYSLKFPNQFEHTETALASVRWVKNFGKRFTLNVISSYRRNTDRFELVKDHPETVPYNYHLTDNLGEELWIDYRSAAGTTSLGGDYTYNHIYSTVLGEKLDSPEKSGLTQRDGNGNKKKIYYTKGKTREVSNFWIRHNKNFGKFSVAGSAGLSSNQYGETFIWSVDGEYYPIANNKNWVIEAGSAQSMRLPTFTDLYYTATGYVGNANLKPEKAITYKIGTTYKYGKCFANISGYYREGRDIIDWVKESAEDNWHSMQITKLNTYGIETTEKYISESGFVRNITFAYSHIYTDKKSQGQISKYALDYMKDKASLLFQCAVLPKIRVTAIGTLYNRKGNYTNASGEMKSYKPYFLLDARINWDYKLLSLYLDTTNITSTKYFDYGGLEMPKIWASAGISITIK